MSFALEYRKKMQAEAEKTRSRHKTRAARRPKTDFVVDAARGSDDTPGNRRCVLAALLLAGLILAVFNSGGLVRYAGGLGYNALVMKIIIASEDWHSLMERSRMTALMDGIRGAVTAARQSSWHDLAFGVDLTPTHPYLTTPATARSEDGQTDEEQGQRTITEPEAEPEGPDGSVMRAAVER